MNNNVMTINGPKTIHIYAHTCMHTYIYVYICRYVYINVYICIYMYINVNVPHAHVYTCKREKLQYGFSQRFRNTYTDTATCAHVDRHARMWTHMHVDTCGTGLGFGVWGLELKV